MAARTLQGANSLTGFRLPNRFEKGLGAQLPESYKKFWYEWREKEPAAVHYIPKEGKWERNEKTGEVKPIQNVPIPLMFPKEHNYGIWGGEAIIKGFQKRNPTKRRVPHFWVPVLKKSVIHSVVLNEYFSVVVTDRTLDLIHKHHGFDHYLLKTDACDIKSGLALRLKRKILQELEKGCPKLQGDASKQKSVLNEFQSYLKNYTSEEIEWYGYSFKEAIDKLEKILKIKENAEIIPHKILFREQLLIQLKEEKETGGSSEELTETKSGKSWVNKLNPFGKKEE